MIKFLISLVPVIAMGGMFSAWTSYDLTNWQSWLFVIMLITYGEIRQSMGVGK